MRTTALIVLLGVLTACSPWSFNVTVGPSSRELRETTVIRGSGAKIALIDLRGLIVDSEIPGVLGPRANPVDELLARFAKAERDDAVKGVVLRIDSPGGTVAASESISGEIERFKRETGKPVVVSMGEITASGGYYVALSGDELYAQPTTITGSIGVIIPTWNFSEGMARIGIESRAVKSGKNKDLANPFEPVREGQYEVLQGIVDEFYAGFRQRVLDHRELDPAKVDELTDGRVFTGATAQKLGLVDATGSLRDAFARAKELAGIPDAKLVKYHGRDEAKPRTAYAEGGLAPEVNLVQFRFDSMGVKPGVAYYLWRP